MGERVPYEVTVSADDGSLRATYSTGDAGEFVGEWGDDDCYRLQFAVGSSDIAVSLGAMETCPTP